MKLVNFAFISMHYDDNLGRAYFQNVSPFKVKMPPPTALVGRTSITVGFFLSITINKNSGFSSKKKTINIPK